MIDPHLLFHLPQAGFLLVLILPFLVGQLALTRYRKKQQYAYNSSILLAQLLVPRSDGLRRTKIVGWLLIWIFMCLAFMQPYGNVRYSPLPSATPSFSQLVPHEIIFLVDTSASMRVPDSFDQQTRLEAAKNIMEDLLSQLKGQIVALYAFTSELTAVVPPTLDYLFTRLAIKDLQINQGDIGGTQFGSVLNALKQDAFPEPSAKRYTIIMLTDGGDTQLENLKGEALKKATDLILNAIPDPQKFHLRLFTIGLGSLQPQPIPDVTFQGQSVSSQLEPLILQQLASQERGRYYMAEEWTSWNLAQHLMTQIKNEDLNRIDEMHLERQVAAAQNQDAITDLYYQIPLGLALLFYFLNFLIPDVRRL